MKKPKKEVEIKRVEQRPEVFFLNKENLKKKLNIKPTNKVK